MPASKAEQVLDALKTLLETVPEAVVQRNSVLPEKVPAGGLIILRDGDPGQPEQVGERFFQEFTLRQVLLNAAKNGSGLSAAGTSSRAEGPHTAEPAATTACPVPEVSSEPTGGSAPTASTP